MPAGADPARRELWLTRARRASVTIWVAIVIHRTATDGLAFNRELLLLYIATGLIAACIGRGHKVVAVLRDWLPFALVLVLYDLSRGAADMLGGSTLWQFQPAADRWLFFGTVPTVWLQEHIKMAQPPWWEVIISGIYMSFFVLPYVVAGVLWLLQPDRVGGVRPPVRRAVLRRARGVRGGAGGAAVGGSELHAGRCRRWAVRPAVHVSRPGGCSRRRTAGRDAHEPARCPPVRGADLHPRLGNVTSAVGRSAARLRTGQREPGRSDSVATRRSDGDDLDVPVATGQARLAPAAGGLPIGDGVRLGVLGRAFRRRHLARLGARRSGVSTPRPTRLMVVAAPCIEISSPLPWLSQRAILAADSP